HAATALETTSIHLTIGVAALTMLDVLQSVVDSLAGVGEFRKSLPTGIDPADQGSMAAIATKVMAEVAETMRQRAPELSADSAARLSRRHAHRTRPVAVRPLASLAA